MIPCQWLQQRPGILFCGYHLVRSSTQLEWQKHVLCGVVYGATGAALERKCDCLYSISKLHHIMLPAPYAEVVVLIGFRTGRPPFLFRTRSQFSADCLHSLQHLQQLFFFCLRFVSSNVIGSLSIANDPTMNCPWVSFCSSVSVIVTTRRGSGRRVSQRGGSPGLPKSTSALKKRLVLTDSPAAMQKSMAIRVFRPHWATSTQPFSVRHFPPMMHMPTSTDNLPHHP